MAHRDHTGADGRDGLLPLLLTRCSRSGLLGVVWVFPEALSMWTKLKRVWDWGYYAVLVWILIDQGEIPTVREAIYFTLLGIVVLFLMLGSLMEPHSRRKRFRSIWWIPLAYGIAFYTLPRLIQLIFNGPIPRLWNRVIVSVLGIWVIVSIVQLIRMRKTGAIHYEMASMVLASRS